VSANNTTKVHGIGIGIHIKTRIKNIEKCNTNVGIADQQKA